MNYLQAQGFDLGLPIAVIVAILFVFVFFIILIRRYKRCPSDRILVVYGKVGGGQSAKCIHGGAAFIVPVFQDYQFLNLTPISIEVNLVNALSKQNIRVNVPSRFTIGVSTEPGVMQNAAERLLGLGAQDVQDLAKEIIFGQLRLVVASMDIEEINNDRDKFLTNISKSVETELKKVGLKLINVNITDIVDESGYIEALGKEAAAHAINAARKSVAEKNRDGSIGEANAVQDQRSQVAAANAQAVEGENTAKIAVANSDSLRRQREAEAGRVAIASEKVQSAKALQESYAAEQEAETARAERERSSQMADIIIPAEIDKRKVEIDAEAEAERIRRRAKGEADAILFKAQAEAQGQFEVLTKQAQGLQEIVKAAGNNSKDAVLLLIADKLPELVRLQAEAIKNIKIDKVTVWDSGNNGENGKSSTANFLSGMYKSVPPLQEMFNMAGMDLPEYLKGKDKAETQAPNLPKQKEAE
ncbi:flotillin family protein [Subsaximicrobium wynnwilliamsii]|uniref:Flotillin family protein n=1 Tax=Subsaximicrobium wynnwilliamsii TaxID=291179 RepID=A0A5C6ZGJ9_9FLAO|nr:flotillin family protein [Subsaximicrobium wynnwilliamsii]TXD82172.1 flotillin family protein [Subsaximicrobium wynnwilliamsii]TXD87811.1 flotillin family protein [Subsaximicrobium wynnwilliamsii]TXE01761.1 flotillin family protein [Subsaximicrobium wynnwilliamsii]